MTTIRLLNSGNWNKPPVLTAARNILMNALARHAPVTTLGEMASFVNGTSYDTGLLTSDGVAIIRISNITDPTSEYLRTIEEFDDKYTVKRGDLLVSWSASFKSIMWPGPIGILNQHIFKVTEKRGNTKGYIRHAIEAAFDEMQQKVVGIGMMHLRRGDFLGHRIPKPDMSTQIAVADFLDWLESGQNTDAPSLPDFLHDSRRIVARIEELAGKVEEARRLRRQTLEEAEALYQHVAADLFPEPAGSVVGAFIRFQTGYAFKSEWFSEMGMRLARNVNVGHGALDWSDTAHISEERRLEFSRFELQPGDILISLDRPIISTGVKVARVKQSDTPCLLLQRVARAQFQSDKVLPDYFYRWLRSPHFVNAIDPGRSNGVPHISHKDIEKILFTPPPLSDQRRIVAELDDLQRKADGLKALQAETSAELDALMPSILDKAFRGEL